MILQEQEHTAFLAGRNYSSGKGPTTVALAKKQKRQQLKRSRDYQRAFAEQNFDLGDKDAFFIPAKRAKHRHPEVSSFGIEGRQLFEDHLTRDMEDIPPTPATQSAGTPVQPKDFGNVENPPLLAFLQGFKITTCYGCKTKFAPGLKKTPEDLILKLLVKRDRLVKEVDTWLEEFLGLLPLVTQLHQVG